MDGKISDKVHDEDAKYPIGFYIWRRKIVLITRLLKFPSRAPVGQISCPKIVLKHIDPKIIYSV